MVGRLLNESTKSSATVCNASSGIFVSFFVDTFKSHNDPILYGVFGLPNEQSHNANIIFIYHMHNAQPSVARMCDACM